MRTAEEWAVRSLEGDAALVLGWRKGLGIAAGRLKIAKEMHDELQRRAQDALKEIGHRTVRLYEPAAQLEADEVFLLTIDDLPSRLSRRRPGRQPKTDDDDASDEREQASELISKLGGAGGLDPIGPDGVRGQTFLFYAVVFSSHDNSIAFLKRHNPGSILKTGRLLGLFGDVVTRIEDPVLVFERDFDLVIDGGELAVLSPTALSRLFVDLDVAESAVPVHLAELGKSQLKFADGALDAIETACKKRRLLAGRLQVLLEAKHIDSLTVHKVQKYLHGLKEDPKRFIQNGEISAAEDDVAALLDVLDQRNYRGGYDDFLRRADRTSVVSKQPPAEPGRA